MDDGCARMFGADKDASGGAGRGGYVGGAHCSLSSDTSRLRIDMAWEDDETPCNRSGGGIGDEYTPAVGGAGEDNGLGIAGGRVAACCRLVPSLKSYWNCAGKGVMGAAASHRGVVQGVSSECSRPPSVVAATRRLLL